MINEKVNHRETLVDPKRCPTKHKNAYKTSFGGKFCPACGHNIKEQAVVIPAKLPRAAYAKSLGEILEEYRK